MARRPAYSNLMKAVQEGHFVFTGELEPKKILNLEKIIHSAKEMKKTGRIVAANVTDGPQVVMNAPGLPIVGSFWNFDSDTDQWAFCHPDMLYSCTNYYGLYN